MSGRTKGMLGIIVAGIVMLAPAGPAVARIADDPLYGGNDRPVPVNARGTDVAAPDQQASAPINARGTDVAAADQQLQFSSGPVAGEPALTGDDDALPTTALVALLALGLAGLASASWFAVSRRRHRPAA